MEDDKMKGIDVSTLQGKIDWKKVAASGVKFAMIKATQGRGEGIATRHLKRFTDSKFKGNITAASGAGVACGVYHYFTAQTVDEARTEALYFCSIIAPYRKHITLWAAVDVESDRYLSKLGKSELAEVVREFLDTVKANGFKPMLYTNPNYLTYKFPADAFSDSDIWLAHYGVKSPKSVPNTRIWQHGTGRVDGIGGVVDVNEGYFKLPKKYTEGDKYTIRLGDVYTNGRAVPAWLFGEECTILQVREGRILLGEINSWVRI
jgi:lysozyme